jgi:hypothetical protein
MSDYKERMREYLKSPDNGNKHYGQWGALNVEQRRLILRLLDEMDITDKLLEQLINFKNRKKDCDNCKNWKTMKCPNSSKCYNTEVKPYFEEKVRTSK